MTVRMMRATSASSRGSIGRIVKSVMPRIIARGDASRNRRRRRSTPALRELGELRRRQRLREQEPLRERDALAQQEIALRLVLDTFADDREVEALRDGDDRLADRGVGRILRDPVHEAVADLDAV